MQMLRSMYAGISGMKNFQTKLDVIGNNIANVNTPGFKKSRVTFNDLMSQQISAASAPNGGRGGINPKQVGLGSKVGSIDTVHTNGFTQTTDRPLDVAIQGDGFFEVRDGNQTYYTRAGNFYFDNAGNLVNSAGMYVTDVGGGNIHLPNINNAETVSIGEDGTVRYTDGNGNLQIAGQIGVVKFANPDGLEKAGGTLFRQTPNSGAPSALAEPGTNGTGSLAVGALEMSNVDLSEEMTEMIVAERGFQANTRIITTSDQILQELVNLKR
jgi:flagellar hook protein FlgE